MVSRRPTPSQNERRVPRCIGVLAPVAALVWCSLGVAGPDDPPPNDPSPAFLARHCQECHAGNKPKGDFRLDSLSPDFGDKANREKWLSVLGKLKSGAMPPKEKPRPPAHEVKALMDWISGRVEKAMSAGSGSTGFNQPAITNVPT